MPHPEKVKPAFSQVGVLSVGVNLSVAHNLIETWVEQTLFIRPNANSLIIDVDYVFPDSVHRRLPVYYTQFPCACQGNGRGENQFSLSFTSQGISSSKSSP